MKAWISLTVLLLVLPSALMNQFLEEFHQSYSSEETEESTEHSAEYKHPGSLLYEYGPSHKDMVTEVEDDGGTDEIVMHHSFKFFGKTYRSCYVNNNGAISFNEPMNTYTPDAFPIVGHHMICPLWTDVDNECGGDIFHRQTRKKVFLEKVSSDVNKVYQNLNYNATWAFVATWHKVAYHGTESNKTNTFQCVLLADRHQRSVVIFNYHDIQWTTGTASGGDPQTGLGGIPAQAGFNAGLGYFNMPMSRTPHILNIKSSSNVGLPGRWVFRVDDFQVPGGCIYKDSFLQHGQTMWSDDSCLEKCVCRFEGKVHCEHKPCDEGFVCLPAGRHFLCQINEEDC